MSPSKFEAQATGSPTKLSVPNRKVRNQPSNRIHDIEFAAEISTSLIAQVRNLQALLAEKEEELKETKSEKLRLEYESENFQQRLKALDENEHRYKDENWSLETQLHELMTAQKEAADREKKLTQSLNLLQADRNTTQQKLDEVRLTHARLVEEHAAAVKRHDIELGTAKRNKVLADGERSAMQRKIEDLTVQNQELAKAISSQRGRATEREQVTGLGEEDMEMANDNPTPEHSPPPSPVKGTPRHSMLETETLKTSLGHAQRTIQNLRTNYHREKTERLELRRMLQEARDEVEKLRTEQVTTNKRARRSDAKEFRKPAPRLLGGLRSARSEIFADDPNWEDQPDTASSPASQSSARFGTPTGGTDNENSDQFDTANDASEDAAFETANERGTETDDFHTGAEDFSSEDDVETETESPSKRNTLRMKAPVLPIALNRSRSIDSTASTEDEDDDEYYHYRSGARTPTLPPHQHKFPLRVSRGAFRRSRQGSEEPTLQSSPSSLLNRTPKQGAQSLAAELGDFEGSDNESNLSATPSRRSIRARTATPPPAVPPLPRALMIDSGMMTEPFHEIAFATSDGQQENGLRLSNGFAHEIEAIRAEHDQRIERLANEHDAAQAAALENLRAGHAEELRSLSADHAASLAASSEALESRLADEVSKAEATLRDAFAQEMEILKSNHAEELSNVEATIKEALLQETEAIKSRHAEELNRITVDAMAAHADEISSLKAAHAAEIDSLQAAHSQQLASREAESNASHAAEIEALSSKHSEVVASFNDDRDAARAAELDVLRNKLSDELSVELEEAKAAHARELKAVQDKHSEEMSILRHESETARAAELEDVQAKSLDKLASMKHDMELAHAAEIDSLKAAHAEELSYWQKQVEVAQAEVAAITAANAVQLDQLRSDLAQTHAKELDELQASHRERTEQLKNELQTAHEKELETAKASHRAEIEQSRRELANVHAREISTLKETHVEQVEQSKRTLATAHAQELESLKASLAKQVEQAKEDVGTEHAGQLAALKETHSRELDDMNAASDAAHARELENLKETHLRQMDELREGNKTSHATEIAALAALHSKELESSKAESESSLKKEIALLKESHAREIEALKSQYATAHAQELESFKTALAKQVESTKVEGDAAHTKQLEALNAAHAEILEAHKRDSDAARSQALDSLKISHEKQIADLKNELTAAKISELEILEASHKKELEALRSDQESFRMKALEDLANTHSLEIESLRGENESTKTKELAALRANHAEALEALKLEHGSMRSEELESLKREHAAELKRELEALRTQHDANKSRELDALKEEHAAALARDLETLGAEKDASHSKELENVKEEHATVLARELDVLHKDLDTVRLGELQALKNEHGAVLAKEIKALESKHAADLTRELQELEDKHNATLEKELQTLANERDAAREKEIDELKAAHSASLEELRAEQQAALDEAIGRLKSDHARELDALASSHDTSQAQAIEAMEVSHANELDQLKRENETLLRQEIDAVNARHAELLDAQKQESSAEKDRLLADHASALAALKESLVVPQPVLGISPVNTIETEPMELREDRSSRREAFVIPQDLERPQTPKSTVAKLFGKNKTKAADVPFIAEDETRQSPSIPKEPETPESQRPFREISTNTDVQPRRRIAPSTVDHSSQTTLTAESLEHMMRHKRQLSQDSVTILTARGEVTVTPYGDAVSPSAVLNDAASSGTVQVRRSHESIGSIARAKHRMGDPGTAPTPEPLPSRRPGSAASARTSGQPRPPLPANHREAIEAARTHSSSGGKGPMGPPGLPASAYKNTASRPLTPGSNPPLSPPSVRGTPSLSSRAHIHSPSRLPLRSRQSSVSSFVSEIDTRFNIRGNMGMDAAGLGPNTDPRMIQAITQTMIGEYLWKYTRKTGRGELSENRHRRYFWVHPYTRTLYWSDRDPSAAGRSELKAKSVPIEAVRVVNDDNPMPPGLHRKSLIIVSPGRSIKFTCTTGQRHETWFNALSYLLLRTGEDQQPGAEDIGGNVTQEDVTEFNPSLHRRTPTNRNRAPPSLSSYNSRTTRNESLNIDMAMNIPTLTPTHEKAASVRSSTLSRLSGYLKSGSASGTFGSLRGKNPANDSAIYEASEVHDSAEDLRQIIEEQDREADRLENVRACCDGKHCLTRLGFFRY